MSDKCFQARHNVPVTTESIICPHFILIVPFISTLMWSPFGLLFKLYELSVHKLGTTPSQVHKSGHLERTKFQGGDHMLLVVFRFCC